MDVRDGDFIISLRILIVPTSGTTHGAVAGLTANGMLNIFVYAPSRATAATPSSLCDGIRPDFRSVQGVCFSADIMTANLLFVVIRGPARPSPEPSMAPSSP